MVGRVILSGALAILPILLILRYFRTRDVQPEARRVLRSTFWLGVLSIVPVILIGVPVILLAPRTASITLAALYSSFVGAAIPEEALKLWVIRGYCARQTSFDEPMDGIVYGVTAALGFAALENIIYVWGSGWTVALLRAFTSIPIHAATGAILGHAVARAQFGPAGRFTVWKGFLSAVAVHGLYNYGLIAMELYANRPVLPASYLGDQVYIFLLLLVFVVLIGSVVWTIRTTRRLRSQQLMSKLAQEAAARPAASDEDSGRRTA